MCTKTRTIQVWRNSTLIGGGDVLILLFSLVLGRFAVSWFSGDPLSLRFSLFLLPVWCLSAAIVGLLPAWGLDAVEEFRRIQILLLSLFALGGVAYFFGRGIFYPSRLAYAVAWLTSAVGMPLLRAGMKQVLLRAGAWGCPTVVYGNREFIEFIAAVLRDQPELGYVPVGVFLDSRQVGSTVADLPVLGGLLDTTADADVAIAPMPLATHHPPEEVFDRALADYRTTLLIPESREDIFLWVRPRSMGRLIGLVVASNLFNPVARTIKRVADLILVGLTAPLWIPLLFLLTLAILLADRTSPFYLQTRIGRAGRAFRTIKFRTMIANADTSLAAALERDPDLRREWEASHKLRRDPRVTRLGRVLRRWSLDELPQLINVLTGQMALVGPRPLPPEHDRKLGATVHKLRRKVRPGMTGLWQISGRSEIGTGGMERWDAYYVRNWSVWLDLIVLARTLHAVLSGHGAY